jgi:hypothetical protein
MMVLAHRNFGQLGTLFSRLIDPAATMHAQHDIHDKCQNLKNACRFENLEI